MFSSKLKRPALALAVTAGLLAVAGPASAGTTDEPKEKGTGFTVPSEAVNFLRGSNDAHTAAVVAADFNYKEATQAGPSELDANAKASFSGDAYINEMGIKAKGVMTGNPGGGSDVVAGPTGLKFETEITDYVRLSTAPRVGVKWELSEYDAITSGANRLVDKDLNQPDMGVRDQPDESILVDLPPLQAKVPQARSAVLPELDANANAFLPEVNDEVLAGLNYEPDYIEGTQ